MFSEAYSNYIQEFKEQNENCNDIQIKLPVEKGIDENSEIQRLPRIKISGNNKRLRCQDEGTLSDFF